MTRAELAIEIAKAQITKQNLEISVKRFALGLLNGCGYMKPQTKAQLQNWYNNLVEDGLI